jgi:hypothetical protein
MKVKYTATAKDIRRDIMRIVRRNEPCQPSEIELKLFGKHRMGDVRGQVLRLVNEGMLDLTSDRRLRTPV